jgi:hypothetical protein
MVLFVNTDSQCPCPRNNDSRTFRNICLERWISNVAIKRRKGLNEGVFCVRALIGKSEH